MSTDTDGRRAAARLNDGSIQIETFLGWLDDKTKARLAGAALKIGDPGRDGLCVTLISHEERWRILAQAVSPHMADTFAAQQQELAQALEIAQAVQAIEPGPCSHCNGTGRCPVCDDVYPESGRCVDEGRSEHGYDGSCSRCEGSGRTAGSTQA